MIRGFDASCVQDLVPAKALVDQGLRFGILKLYEGNRTIREGGVDPCFERNVTACIDVGIEPFAYLFAYPLPNDGVNANRDAHEQAVLHVAALRRYPEMCNRPPFLDLEWPAPNEWAKWGCTAKQINAWCRDYAAEVCRLMGGIKPVLYTYPHYWASLVAGGADVSWAAEYSLWLASYPMRNRWPLASETPKVPAPWDTWLFWQFDGDGGLRLPNGVDADFCLFNGTPAELAIFAGIFRPVSTNDADPVVIDGGTVHPRAWPPEPTDDEPSTTT